MFKTLRKLNLRKAIENKDEQALIKYFEFKNASIIDSSQFELLEKALWEKWHSQHEDLVNTIYLRNLKDDRFVDPILNIAIEKETYRRYDDELESTLRKCVHALKTIDSEKSNEAIEKLINLNNNNVKIALEVYE